MSLNDCIKSQIELYINSAGVLPPYDQLTYCNDDSDNGAGYCKGKTGNMFTACHQMSYIGSCFIDNEEIDYCYGTCIPKDKVCDSDDDCKSIGNLHSGMVFATCQDEMCQYDNAIAIA